MITVSIPKAKVITKDRLRLDRKPLLEAQDVLFMKAQESGADTTTSTAWNQTSSSSANYLNLSVTLSSASNDVAIFYGNQLRKSTTATGGHIRVFISGGGLGDGASGKQVVGQLGYSLGNGPDYPFGGCVLDDAPGGTSVTYSIYVVPVSSAGVQFKLNLIAMEMQGAAA